MTHSEIFTGFKNACDEFNLHYWEDIEQEEISFNDRHSSSEGTTRLKAICEKSIKGETILRIESPFSNYYGDDLQKAVESLKQAHHMFYSTN